MSTRSVIAIENDDKQCLAGYCHFDGYVSHTGRILLEHYNSPDKIRALLALGALSAIAPRLAPRRGEKHSYDTPQSDICIAYHRDRGETLRPARLWLDANDLLTQASEQYWADYVYLFRNGEWHVSPTYAPQGWRLVADELAKDDDEC